MVVLQILHLKLAYISADIFSGTCSAVYLNPCQQNYDIDKK
jgi:hypothetical protein